MLDLPCLILPLNRHGFCLKNRRQFRNQGNNRQANEGLQESPFPASLGLLCRYYASLIFPPFYLATKIQLQASSCKGQSFLSESMIFRSFHSLKITVSPLQPAPFSLWPVRDKREETSIKHDATRPKDGRCRGFPTAPE